jgi:phosphatidylglycerol lysyltransferase
MISPQSLRARDLVMQFGWNATSYQIVNPDMTHWFSARGDAVIGYVCKHRVRVVAGAPVCSEDRLPDVVDEWESDANRHGHGVCYFGAAGRIKELLSARPEYSSVVLGAQPVWSPAHWKELIATHASLRAQIFRAINKGVRVEEWQPERATQNPELQRVLREWLQTRGLPPLHFLVEPDTLQFIEDRRVFVALRQERVVGFLVLCPIAERNGWLTEEFPRGFGAPNGTVELLMNCAIQAVAAEGAQYVTMGLVPLSTQTLDVNEQNPRWLKLLLMWTRAHGRRFYNFDGLEKFKAKFRPDEWEAIYAVSNEPRFSPRSLYAIAAAFTGCSPLVAVGRGVFKAVRQEGRWLLHTIRERPRA